MVAAALAPEPGWEVSTIAHFSYLRLRSASSKLWF